MRLLRFFSFYAIIFFTSCRPLQINTTEVSQTQIHSDFGIDSNLHNLVLGYKTGLDKKMNQIISYTEEDLIKEQPGSNLGNMMADAIYHYYLSKGDTIDFAITNQGGIRISSLSKGNLTVGDAYELMPFDNQIVLLKLPGSLVDTLLQHISKLGGWPVSQAEVILNEKNEIKNAFVKNEILNPNKIYKVATHDYLANGGDDCSFLRSYPMLNSEKLLRDAIIEYWESYKNGIPVDNRKRIRYEK